MKSHPPPHHHHLMFTLKMLTATYAETLKHLQQTTQLDPESLINTAQNGMCTDINGQPLLICRSTFGNSKLRLLHSILKEININNLVS
jgi:hypothetical protein